MKCVYDIVCIVISCNSSICCILCYVTDTVKMRQMPGDKSSSVKNAADDALKWVEDNIPAAVADA